jgi:hypothetical protein
VCGGGYLCVEEDTCVWRRILVCGGGYLCVEEDTCADQQVFASPSPSWQPAPRARIPWLFCSLIGLFCPEPLGESASLPRPPTEVQVFYLFIHVLSRATRRFSFFNAPSYTSLYVFFFLSGATRRFSFFTAPSFTGTHVHMCMNIHVCVCVCVCVCIYVYMYIPLL